MDLCYIFLINSLAFSSLNAIEVAISTLALPWQSASQRHKLLNLEHVSKHGWGSLSNVKFDGDGFWVAARANYVDPVSWEGCARWNTSCGSNTVAAGSLAECIKNRPHCSKYMLLNGDSCRCFTDETCIQRTSDPCDDPCRNNPNDWCGGGFGTEAMYHTGLFSKTNYNITESSGGISCIVLIRHSVPNGSISGEQSFMGQDCEKKTRRVICKNKSTEFEHPNSALKNWYEAAEVCQSSNAHLYFNLSSINVKQNRSAYWTSIRRGLTITWTELENTEYPFCVSVNKTRSKITLNAHSCNMKKRYLYMTGKIDDPSDDGKNNGLLIGILVFLAICLPSVGIACFISGKRRTKRKQNILSVRYQASRRQNLVSPPEQDYASPQPPKLNLQSHPHRERNRERDNMPVECDYDYVSVSTSDCCQDDKFSNLEPHYRDPRNVQNRPGSLYDNKKLNNGRLDNYISPNLYNTLDCGYGRTSRNSVGKPRLANHWSQSLERQPTSKASSKPFCPYELAKY